MLNICSQTQMALGSDVTLTYIAAQSTEELEKLMQASWRMIYLFEKQFSRFLPSSELSRFNRSAGVEQRISPSFRQLLGRAQQLSLETAGIFNPFILPKLQQAGYVHSFAEGYETDEHDNFSKRSMTDIDNLLITKETAHIPYGTALDFGGCGKGFLADEIRKSLPAWLSGYYLSFGGDIVAGGTDQFGEAWNIAIQDATDLSASLPHAIAPSLRQFAVATSGTLVRAGTYRGKRWHHIIDPRTGAPADSDVLIATVVAADAITADVLATCAVILGSQKAWPFLRARGAIGALFQTKRSGKTRVSVHGSGIVRQHESKEVQYA